MSDEFTGKVAVITGAASGIGLALALEAARRGMNVALADMGGDALAKAVEDVRAFGGKAIGVAADVRDLENLTRLRDQTEAELGRPWLVVNNAGVTKIALGWDHSEADWRRIIDINLYGVVNGLLAFLPGLKAAQSGYIVNTASAAGLLTIPAAAAYVASKHAVVGLSETLYREFKASDCGVEISVLCPGLVRTNIMGAKADGGSAIESDHAMTPEEAAKITFTAIEARQFWISTHAEHLAPYISARADEIVHQKNPGLKSRDPAVAETATGVTGVDFSNS